MSAIYVWIETFNGKANAASWEAVSAGRSLAASLNVPVTAVVFGENAAAVAAEAGTFGADNAIVADDATLAAFRLEPYAALLSDLVQKNAPKAVLAVASSRGRELLAASSADTDSAQLSDVLSLTVDGDTFSATRPAYAGKVLSDVTANGGTVYVTLRSRAFKAADADAGKSIEVTSVAPVLSEDQISTKIESFEEEVGTVNLTDAAVIVSGGRGIANNPKDAPAGVSGDDATIWKAKDGFENVLQPLADVLGGAVGASRAAVDAGYIPYAHQVGQTGRTVSPDLYIAAGISGAIQHQAGMRSSKIIVAINKDAESPIFKMARYGLVGDLYQIIPALTAELKKRLGK